MQYISGIVLTRQHPRQVHQSLTVEGHSTFMPITIPSYSFASLFCQEALGPAAKLQKGTEALLALNQATQAAWAAAACLSAHTAATSDPRG